MKTLSKSSPLKSGNYLKKGSFFFEPSKLLYAQITDLLDFVWPTATSMWNLRWQVQGYVQVRDESLTNEELFAKFGTDNKILRANIYRACVESTWEEQLDQFASILLVNAFALYESWLDDVLTSLGVPKTDKTTRDGFQTPSRSTSPGILEFLAKITTPESSVLKGTFYLNLTNNKKYCLTELNNLLICYRYFKELRNSSMHRGGICDDRLLKATTAYNAISASDLKAKEKPAYVVCAIGEKISLKIRGVVGFLDIILKIVATLDAELSRSQRAEAILLSRCKKGIVGNKKVIKSKIGRQGNIKKVIQNCNFPSPIITSEFEAWLVSNSLII